MKSQTTLIFLLILLRSNAAAGQTSYGVKVGLNIADQRYYSTPTGSQTLNIDTKFLPGFQIGAFIKCRLNDELQVATEINYSQIGSKIKYTRSPIINPDGSISYSTDIEHYTNSLAQIEIPIWLQYHLNKRFYAGLGPIIGINLSSKIENLQNLSLKTDYYKTIDLGAGILVGCNLYKKIDLNLKYNLGLINIDKRNNINFKNRLLNFSVLYNLK